ncbi:hypothetical protein H5410_042220 [Solanum commersonii]|uniref:Uncharacterized protein n=1 Tax=Solanum commersonii TaxID=4109 RepID=A0A9J5XVD6_SOLCO|nr:hypothetical protein H5410_042220 [Solanum commersonii]
MGKPTHFQGQTSLEHAKPQFLPIFMCYSPCIFGDPKLRLYGFLVIQNLFVPTDKLAHFKGQTSPRVGKPPFLPIFVCYIIHRFLACFLSKVFMDIFDDSKFRHDFCRNFSWTSVKTLVMEPDGPDGQTGSFSRYNEPRACKPPLFADFHVL